jgi:hypothetical protein
MEHLARCIPHLRTFKGAQKAKYEWCHVWDMSKCFVLNWMVGLRERLSFLVQDSDSESGARRGVLTGRP